jgi:hypothetical protein
MTRTSKLAITLSIFAVALRLVLIDQPTSISGAGDKATLRRLRETLRKTGFILLTPRLIGQATRRAMSARNFRFCRF